MHSSAFSAVRILVNFIKFFCLYSVFKLSLCENDERAFARVERERNLSAYDVCRFASLNNRVSVIILIEGKIDVCFCRSAVIHDVKRGFAFIVEASDDSVVARNRFKLTIISRGNYVVRGLARRDNRFDCLVSVNENFLGRGVHEVSSTA